MQFISRYTIWSIGLNTEVLMSGIQNIGNMTDLLGQNALIRGFVIGQIGNSKEGEANPFFAGNLNLPNTPDDKIAAARKQAMKLVKDAFDNDRNTDKGLDEIRADRTAAEEDLVCRQERVAGIQEGVNNYAKEHGITEDSSEQKDLDVVRKVKDYQRDNPFAAKDDPLACLTDDEKERYAGVLERGLTDYQKLALKADDDIRTAQLEMDQDKEMVRAYNTAIKDIKLESLKDQSMVKAQKGKNDIMQAAYKDAVSSVVRDAVEHITEEQEKIKENAEEKAEKKAEEEEKAEKREEEEKQREILEGEAKLERLSEQSLSGDPMSQMNSEIQNILNKLSLLEDDIKGIEVNKQL